MRGVFVTATGTGVGKTTLATALARTLVRAGHDVVALKPIETGVGARAADADALAEACGRPELATDPAWFRAADPVSPYAATLGGAPPVDLERAVARAREIAFGRLAIVEGAGGLLVPIDAQRTMADLARALTLPLLLVAPNRLGVLSDALCVAEAAERRGLAVAALALSQTAASEPDPSCRTNARILRERLPFPVFEVPFGPALPEELIGLVSQ